MSFIIIPSCTVSVGFTTSNPAGTTTWFPNLSYAIVLVVSLPVTVTNVLRSSEMATSYPADLSPIIKSLSTVTIGNSGSEAPAVSPFQFTLYHPVIPPHPSVHIP